MVEGSRTTEEELRFFITEDHVTNIPDNARSRFEPEDHQVFFLRLCLTKFPHADSQEGSRTNPLREYNLPAAGARESAHLHCPWRDLPMVSLSPMETSGPLPRPQWELSAAAEKAPSKPTEILLTLQEQLGAPSPNAPPEAPAPPPLHLPRLKKHSTGLVTMSQNVVSPQNAEPSRNPFPDLLSVLTRRGDDRSEQFYIRNSHDLFTSMEGIAKFPIQTGGPAARAQTQELQGALQTPSPLPPTQRQKPSPSRSAAEKAEHRGSNGRLSSSTISKVRPTTPSSRSC